MRTGVRKPKAKDELRGRRNLPLSPQKVMSPTGTRDTYVQRPSVCPCDGGCPRCVAAIQPKLTIGSPNDKYEQEADRIADEVMRSPEPNLQHQFEENEQEELFQVKPVGDKITPLNQRQIESKEEEEFVQAKGENRRDQGLAGGIESSIQTIRGHGQPLPKSSRAYFERRLGRDLGGVRVHTDTNAARTAKALNARAFTTGQDVAFGQGQYAPETEAGKRLLTHEIAHVIQQDGISTIVQRQAPERQEETLSSIEKPPEPTSDSITIGAAIRLFAASDASRTPFGRDVLGVLRTLHRKDEIAFASLKAGKLVGAKAQSRPDFFRSIGFYDIEVDEEWRRNVSVTALLLVHEAMHLLRKELLYVDQELVARSLEIDFFTELEKGIEIDRYIYQATTNTMGDEYVSRKRERIERETGQLIDSVIEQYWPEEENFIDAAWIKRHIDDWGGLSKRTFQTRGRYLIILCEMNEPSYTQLILQILESAGGYSLRGLIGQVGRKPQGEGEDYKELYGNFDVGAARLRNAFRRQHALYGASNWYRILRLQNIANVDLGIHRSSTQ